MSMNTLRIISLRKISHNIRKSAKIPESFVPYFRFSEKYLEFPNNLAIFVPKNSKDENNIQKYIG